MTYPQEPQRETQPLATSAAPPAQSRPRWARKRIAIPAAAVILLIGVGIGSSGNGGDKGDGKTEAKPAPTVTVTKTAPAPKDDAKPADSGGGSKEKAGDSAGTAKFKVWGTAPSGADITYGTDSDNIEGHGLPMTKTMKVKDDAMYYQVTAQLQGGGDIHCSVTIGDRSKEGHAKGDYNICSAQLNSDFTGGWS